MDKNVKVVHWLVRMRDEWRKNPRLDEFIRQKPQIEMFHWQALLKLLERVIQRRALDLEFGCHDYYTGLYLAAKEDMLDFLRARAGRIGKDQTDRIYRMTFEGFAARRLAYVLNKSCGVPKGAGYPSEEWIHKSFDNPYWNCDELMEKFARKNNYDIEGREYVCHKKRLYQREGGSRSKRDGRSHEMPISDRRDAGTALYVREHCLCLCTDCCPNA